MPMKHGELHTTQIPVKTARTNLELLVNLVDGFVIIDDLNSDGRCAVSVDDVDRLVSDLYRAVAAHRPIVKVKKFPKTSRQKPNRN